VSGSIVASDAAMRAASARGCAQRCETGNEHRPPEGISGASLGVTTLVASDDQPEGLAAPSQGNAQTTSDGDLFVGWGALPYFSEFDPAGQLVFNAQFPTGVNSYRAYLLRWQSPTGHLGGRPRWPFGHPGRSLGTR